MTELVLRSGSTASGCRDVVVDPKCAGWTYSGLTIASLTKDETLELTTDDHEYLVLPLEGSFIVQGDGFRADLAGRSTIWGEVTDYASCPVTGQSPSLLSVADGWRCPTPSLVRTLSQVLPVHGGACRAAWGG